MSSSSSPSCSRSTLTSTSSSNNPASSSILTTSSAASGPTSSVARTTEAATATSEVIASPGYPTAGDHQRFNNTAAAGSRPHHPQRSDLLSILNRAIEVSDLHMRGNITSIAGGGDTPLASTYQFGSRRNHLLVTLEAVGRCCVPRPATTSSSMDTAGEDDEGPSQ